METHWTNYDSITERIYPFMEIINNTSDSVNKTYRLEQNLEKHIMFAREKHIMHTRDRMILNEHLKYEIENGNNPILF